MNGWIKLHRKICDNPIWMSESFTRGQAWVDLLLLANHIDSFFYKRGNKVDVKRGEIARSIVELSDRWQWSRGKVKRFLNELESEHQIEQQNNVITTLISIVNYDEYQETGSRQDSKQNSRRAADGQQTDTYNNDKKEKNVKKEIEIPAWDEFRKYALENKPTVDVDALKLKYQSWVENKWNDGNNKPIKNWKSKLLNTIPYFPGKTFNTKEPPKYKKL